VSVLARPVGVLVVGLQLAACNEAGDHEAAMQAGRLVHAVRQLRDAPPDNKGAPLSALRTLECDGDRCELKSTCVEAYELHVRGIQRLAAARHALDGTADPLSRKAAETLDDAEQDLQRSAELTKQCADVQGEITRRYRLE
jgi:hypothetical protein